MEKDNQDCLEAIEFALEGKWNSAHEIVQEKIEEGSNVFRCSICKEKALTINGLLENHKASCNYRIDKEKLLSGKK